MIDWQIYWLILFVSNTFTAVQPNHWRQPRLALWMSICSEVVLVVTGTTIVVVVHFTKVRKVSLVKAHVHEVAEMTIFTAWPAVLHDSTTADSNQRKYRVPTLSPTEKPRTFPGLSGTLGKNFPGHFRSPWMFKYEGKMAFTYNIQSVVHSEKIQHEAKCGKIHQHSTLYLSKQ